MSSAGQEMFSSLTRQYYKGAGAVIFVFSSTDLSSFRSITQWHNKIKEEVGDPIGVLVQNKCDLEEFQVEKGKVEQLATELGLKLYRISVRDKQLVDSVFEYLAECYLNNDKTTTATAMPSALEIAKTQAEQRPENALIQQSDLTYSRSDKQNETQDESTSSNRSKSSNESANFNSGSMNEQKSNPQSITKGESVVNCKPLTQRTGGKKKQDCCIQ